MEQTRKRCTYKNGKVWPSAFFQQAITVRGIFIEVVFANIYCLQRFNEELKIVTSAGCNSTFKSVPKISKQFRSGTLMMF